MKKSRRTWPRTVVEFEVALTRIYAMRAPARVAD
jgi:hypothetical protein